MKTQMQIKYNEEQLKDKILGCWIGKNIGGTMGAPYEENTNMQDITGFATKMGGPIPNDDLDLQLIWLIAMEDVGANALSSNILAEYWLSRIPPHWNEYGICKANMQYGLMPPLSGEFNNARWKDSNGAWIRSEIWACLAPGFPNVATKYAVMDACIDHGINEGTYAEIFTAALESYAFIESDVRTLIEKALTFISEESRLYKCITLVLSEYDKKTPYRDVRNMIVEEVSDLGWFSAPGNLSFMVIGLLYGEGDFKQSLIYAINCGDDTDCTAATCGSILGIICGAKAIPEELKEHVGDRIVTISTNGSYLPEWPKTCTELTDRVMKLIPSVLRAQGVYMTYTDGEAEFDADAAFEVAKCYANRFIQRKKHSFEINNGPNYKAVVEYDKVPTIAPMESFKFTISFSHKFRQPLRADIDVILPEGWSAYYNKSIFIGGCTYQIEKNTVSTFVVTAGENVNSKNEIIIKFTSPLSPLPMFIPITLLGNVCEDNYVIYYTKNDIIPKDDKTYKKV